MLGQFEPLPVTVLSEQSRNVTPLSAHAYVRRPLYTKRTFTMDCLVTVVSRMKMKNTCKLKYCRIGWNKAEQHTRRIENRENIIEY